MKVKLIRIVLGSACIIAAMVVTALWPDLVIYGNSNRGNWVLDAAGFALFLVIIGVMSILDGIFLRKKK